MTLDVSGGVPKLVFKRKESMNLVNVEIDETIERYDSS